MFRTADKSHSLCDTCCMHMSYCPAEYYEVEMQDNTNSDIITGCPYYEGNPELEADGTLTIIQS